MPFTASHPAAVLVGAAPLARWGLPVPALVIGSIAPDIFTMLPIPSLVHFAHTPLGLITVDVGVGVVAFLLWQAFFAPALVAIAPTPLRARLPRSRYLPGNPPLEAPSRRGLPGKFWDLGAVAVAVLLGAATHLAWDSFTHDWMWGPRHIRWLAEPHGPLLGWQWVQRFSDVIGLAVVVSWAVARWRSAPVRPSGPVLPVRYRVLAWLVILGPAAIAFCLLLIARSFYVAITTASALGLIALAAVASRVPR